jgi:trimethylamine---corrinoid protein Co-methyltransferase
MEFHVLSNSEIECLYTASLECLERTGVNVLNEEARHLLEKAGSSVDGVRVRIPAQVMRDALVSCPPGFTLYGRDPSKKLDVFPGQVHFGPGLTSSYFVDPFTHERRRSLRQDTALAARVCDALDNIDYLMGLVLPDDVPAGRASVFEFAEMLLNSGKPLLAWANSLENVQEIYSIASAVVGGEEALRERPLFALFAVGLGPLVHPDSILGNVLWCAERYIPVIYHGPGVSGVSAPVTGAGTLLINLAGCLSGLAITQLKQPGAPVSMGAVPSPMDPRTGRPSYGSPELSLYSAALADVANYLNLPYMGTAGASEAKTVDLQAGIESTVQVLFSLLSKTTIPHDAGFLDCADIGSLEMLVMNDEIISMGRRMLRGIEITPETLMLDHIDEVGPGGEFLSRVETAHLFRKEIWMPRLMNRDPWVHWEEKGSFSMSDRIQERLHKIIASHSPLPVVPEVVSVIHSILDKPGLQAIPVAANVTF